MLALQDSRKERHVNFIIPHLLGSKHFFKKIACLLSGITISSRSSIILMQWLTKLSRYFDLNDRIIPWSQGWITDVVFEVRNSTVTFVSFFF